MLRGFLESNLGRPEEPPRLLTPEPFLQPSGDLRNVLSTSFVCVCLWVSMYVCLCDCEIVFGFMQMCAGAC